MVGNSSIQKWNASSKLKWINIPQCDLSINQNLWSKYGILWQNWINKRKWYYRNKHFYIRMAGYYFYQIVGKAGPEKHLHEKDNLLFPKNWTWQLTPSNHNKCYLWQIIVQKAYVNIFKKVYSELHIILKQKRLKKIS